PLPVLRRRPAGRTRGCLLRSTPETSRRLRSQIRESPDSPGRFIGGLACLLSLAAPSLIATPNLPLNRALHTHPELILDTLLLPNPTLKLTPVVVD
ncbi:hypothetical protein FVP45_22840, partial [Mycobacterium tuberculosis]|nr:hypothetical protein [Mycobacterium tuberculosis]NKE43034.1 hypothetical protein [Mycobacterium tuberculosis]